MREKRDCWVCEKCGYVWLAVGIEPPTHCASRKCRSRQWNASAKDQTAADNDDTVARNMNGSINQAATSEQPLDVETKVCPACENPLRQVKGKWACGDPSCGLYGQEQK